MAQGRALFDPKTAEALSAIVQTQERLKMLLTLTAADIRAVGPGVWNGWKGQLLRTLYWETEVTLGGGHSATIARGASKRLRRPSASCSWLVRSGVRRLCPTALSGLLAKSGAARQAAHARLLHAMAADTHSLATEVTTDVFHGVTAVTVIAPDHPRLLPASPAPAPRPGATSSTPRSSPRPTALRSTPFSFRALSSATRTNCGGGGASRPTLRRPCEARSGWPK